MKAILLLLILTFSTSSFSNDDLKFPISSAAESLKTILSIDNPDINLSSNEICLLISRSATRVAGTRELYFALTNNKILEFDNSIDEGILQAQANLSRLGSFCTDSEKVLEMFFRGSAGGVQPKIAAVKKLSLISLLKATIIVYAELIELSKKLSKLP
jgi:hypothetical protein